jgi:hypothetical protein
MCCLIISISDIVSLATDSPTTYKPSIAAVGGVVRLGAVGGATGESSNTLEFARYPTNRRIVDDRVNRVLFGTFDPLAARHCTHHAAVRQRWRRLVAGSGAPHRLEVVVEVATCAILHLVIPAWHPCVYNFTALHAVHRLAS